MLKTLYKYIEYGGIIYERSYYSTLECRCYQPENDLSLIFLISSGNYECYFSIVDDDFLFTKKCIYHENKPRVFLQLFCVSQITFPMICFYKPAVTIFLGFCFLCMTNSLNRHSFWARLWRYLTCGIAYLVKRKENLTSVRDCRWKCKWKERI
jgi:hypothetical protein